MNAFGDNTIRDGDYLERILVLMAAVEGV